MIKGMSMIFNFKAILETAKLTLRGFRMIRDDLIKNIILLILIMMLWMTYNSMVDFKYPIDSLCAPQSEDDLPDM